MSDKIDKSLNVMYSHSLRDLVDAVNEASLQKDDIVNIFKAEENYVLLYYK